jgi:PEGA domain
VRRSGYADEMLLVPLLALLAAAPAQRLVVVDVDAPDMMMGLAGQVTRAVLTEAATQKFVVTSPDDLRKALPTRQYETLRKCGGKPACVAQALDGQPNIGRVVVGQLNRDEKNYLLRLWLIDVPTLTVVADVDRAVLIAARRLQKDLDEAVPRLLRGEREARGSLTLESNRADAQIFVNGEFVGVPPVTLTLKPGKYEVKLERKKYLSVTRLLAVEANQKATERIVLLLRPGEVADEDEPSLVKKAPGGAAATSTAGLVLSAPTWISLITTVAAGGTSLYFAFTSRAQEQHLLAGFDATAGVYSGFRTEAVAAQQNALIANVLFGVTGAAFVATVIFFVRDVLSMSQSTVTVAPALTGNGGGLVVGGRF